ncbi:hypothetical protein LTR17_027579, partial [Elasticomyces elasticus]
DFDADTSFVQLPSTFGSDSQAFTYPVHVYDLKGTEGKKTQVPGSNITMEECK